MNTDKNCPVCLEMYVRGERPRHGKHNSRYAVPNGCRHYICYDCCLTLGRIIRDQDRPIACPICREDWTAFLWDNLVDAETDSELDYTDDDGSDDENNNNFPVLANGKL